MSVKLSSLTKRIHCDIHGTACDCMIDQVGYNSHVAEKNSLFFCLPGARVDGHLFAQQAYDNGCRAFVVERLLSLPVDSIQVVVPSSREALAYISAEFYDNPAEKMTIIGVTGTKGKTTTSILIEEIFSSCGIKCGYIGSNGVIIGDRHFDTINSTPESHELHKYFSMMQKMGYTHVVMEVSSQALDNYRVCGIHFDTVIYTNLSPDHIGKGEHASFEEYRDAKHKLFTDYSAAHFIFNNDDLYSAFMQNGATGEHISYGITNASDYMASSILPYRDSTSLGIDFDVVNGGSRTHIRLRTPGSFSVYNGLAAIAACSIYGIAPTEASIALKNISIKGRFEIVDYLDGITFIIDYAHNGLSLTKALTVLREYNPSRLICLFGCIGGRTYGRRRELAEASAELADFSIITSDNPDWEDPDDIIRDVEQYFDKRKLFTTITDREAAVRFAVRTAKPGDIVLFAGKGHENYQLVNGKKVPFSEKKIILDEAHHIIDKSILLNK